MTLILWINADLFLIQALDFTLKTKRYFFHQH